MTHLMKEPRVLKSVRISTRMHGGERILHIEDRNGKDWNQVADSSDMARLWTEVRKLEGYTDATE